MGVLHLRRRRSGDGELPSPFRVFSFFWDSRNRGGLLAFARSPHGPFGAMPYTRRVVCLSPAVFHPLLSCAVRKEGGQDQHKSFIVHAKLGQPQDARETAGCNFSRPRPLYVTNTAVVQQPASLLQY